MARLLKAGPTISGSGTFGPCVHAVRQHTEIWAKLTQSMTERLHLTVCVSNIEHKWALALLGSLMLASMGASVCCLVRCGRCLGVKVFAVENVNNRTSNIPHHFILVLQDRVISCALWHAHRVCDHKMLLPAIFSQSNAMRVMCYIVMNYSQRYFSSFAHHYYKPYHIFCPSTLLFAPLPPRPLAQFCVNMWFPLWGIRLLPRYKSSTAMI